MKLSFPAIALAALFLALPRGYCQWKELPSTGSPTERVPDRTTLAGQSGLGPLVLARLVDEHKNARQHKAIIEVETDGVEIVDPQAAHLQPRIDEAHIQYRLDGGPVHNSTSKTWTFARLSPGKHEIEVALAGSDNHPLGKPEKLHVHIP